MNNNDFEIILDLATEGERYSAEEFAATRAAEIEMAARLTPITPEALIDDGYTEDGPDKHGRTEYVREFKRIYDGERIFVTVWIEATGDVTVNAGQYGDRWEFFGVANIYDVRELVRLLGGAQ